MKKITVLFLTFVSALLFNPLLAQNHPSQRHYALSCDYIPNFNPNKLTVLSPFGYKHMTNIQADCNEEYWINSYDYILSINGIPAGKFKDITEAKSATVVPAEDGRVHIKYFSMLVDTVCQMSYIPCDVETVGLDESDFYACGLISFSKLRFAYADGSQGVRILSDDNVKDWAKYRRFAFIPRSNDPLVEKDYAKRVLDELIGKKWISAYL